MGDVSCLMPTIHPYVPGAAGKGHGNDYRIENPDLACLMSAKWQLCMLRILMENGGARAKEILAGFTPRFPDTESYLKAHEALSSAGDRVFYEENGDIRITL